MRGINNLASAQAQKDTPSLIDVKGLGRPKELSGKEEDLQQWSKKIEAFFDGVLKESVMMLEWAAEQGSEITWEAVDLAFLPTVPNVETRCAALGVRVAADACSTDGAHELRGE